MMNDPSLIKSKDFIENYPEKTNNILLLGSKINLFKSFSSFFKSLCPRLIFLDLSMYYKTTKREIKEDICNSLVVENIDASLGEIYNQTRNVSEEFWQKTELLLEKCKFVLNEKGFFSVKVNGTIKSRLKSILDTLFGSDRFINEIIIDSPFKIWYNLNSEVFERTNYILMYSQSLVTQISPVYNEKESGGYWHSFVSKGAGKPKKFLFEDEGEVILTPPPGTHWKLKQETILELCKTGQIRLNKNGNPEYWVPKKKGQIIDSNWLDVRSYEWFLDQRLTNSSSLYNRLLSMCLKENDLFIDLSTDTGVSLVVAERLKMRWIGFGEDKHLFELIVKNLTDKRIIFSVYKDNSLPDSLHDTNHSYTQKKSFKNSEHSNFPGKLSLQIVERYKATKIISNKSNLDEWTNMLILGDNFDVLPLLVPKLRKMLKVIYIDPPFFTGSNENIVIPIGLPQERDHDKTDNVAHSFEDVAYRNVLDSSDPIKFFKKWFKNKILLMKPLLRDDGFIFVRFDYHYGHYAKIMLDEVFGEQNFVNEFLVRRMKKNLSLKQAYSQTHLIVHSDSIFLYQVSEKAQLKPSIIKKRIRRGQDIAEKQYTCDNLWLDIAGYEKIKKTLYPTENSETLLSRIIRISSDEEDIIADFFCGSGTTIAVSEKLKRKWVGVDIGQYSINESRKRILKISPSVSFDMFQISDSYKPNLQTHVHDTSSTSSYDSFGSELADDEVRRVPMVKLDLIVNNNELKIKIIEFTPSKLIDISRKQYSIKYIDFWAIDWNKQNNYFQAMWYSYRKMKGKIVLKNVETFAIHEYSDPGNYIVIVSVVDVFGNSSKQKFSINIH